MQEQKTIYEIFSENIENFSPDLLNNETIKKSFGGHIRTLVEAITSGQIRHTDVVELVVSDLFVLFDYGIDPLVIERALFNTTAIALGFSTPKDLILHLTISKEIEKLSTPIKKNRVAPAQSVDDYEDNLDSAVEPSAQYAPAPGDFDANKAEYLQDAGGLAEDMLLGMSREEFEYLSSLPSDLPD